MPSILFTSVLKLRRVIEPDGLQRADATMARDAQMLHLGTVGPNGEIGIAFLTEAVERDPVTKEPKPLPPEMIVTLEFLISPQGMTIPDGYQFRAAVLSAQGMLYVFERVDPEQQKLAPRGRILIPTGRGVG